MDSLRPISAALHAEATHIIPGGVNSPVRAFRAVGGTPVYFERGAGAYLWDVDGNRYLDFVNSWGASILGHANPQILAAIHEAASRGTSYGAPHRGEIALADEVIKRVPSIEQLRLVNSGTEASLAVLRLVRAATGRPKVLKFAGNYHGAVDSLLVRAGSGVATLGIPDSAGVAEGTIAQTAVARFNDLDDVRRNFEHHRGEIAAVLVEPVAGNMGCVPPQPGFLQGLREIADAHGTLLVFDEVMTGFRVSRGGATELYGVTPDLICFGKVIGGGLPVGAYGGKRDLMQWIAPAGPVYQAGTLSGNPLAVAAGLAALRQLDSEVYESLEKLGEYLEKGLTEILGNQGHVNRVGSMLSVFFSPGPTIEFDTAQATDRECFGKIFHALLDEGFYLPPSALEAWFLTASHSETDINLMLAVFEKALRNSVPFISSSS